MYMYIYIYIYTHMCMCMYMYMYTHLHVYVYVYVSSPEREAEFAKIRVGTDVTFWPRRPWCFPMGGFTGAQEWPISHWRCVSQGCPQGQTLRALLLRVTSALH